MTTRLSAGANGDQVAGALDAPPLGVCLSDAATPGPRPAKGGEELAPQCHRIQTWSGQSVQHCLGSPGPRMCQNFFVQTKLLHHLGPKDTNNQEGED